MERKLLDMMNQLSISEYNPRMEYCDKFKFAERLSKVENHKLKDNNVLIDFNKTKEITVSGMNNVTIEITSVF